MVMFRKPKLGQVKSAGQVKAGGLVPDKLGATEVLDEAKKALESGRRSGLMRSEPVTVVEVDAGQEEAVVVAVEVLVVLSGNTARVAATDGGSSKETPRSRAATAARTASGAGVGRADTRSVVVRSETGAIVEAMRQAGTGGVGSAVVALATAK